MCKVYVKNKYRCNCADRNNPKVCFHHVEVRRTAEEVRANPVVDDDKGWDTRLAPDFCTNNEWYTPVVNPPMDLCPDAEQADEKWKRGTQCPNWDSKLYTREGITIYHNKLCDYCEDGHRGDQEDEGDRHHYLHV